MKRVRFEQPENICRVLCEVISLDQLTLEEYARTWYSWNDYDNFRRSAKIVAKEIRSYGRDKLLDGAMKNILDKNKDDTQTTCMLIKWSRQGFLCRGLERWINDSQGRLRKQEHQRTIEAVLHVQQQREKENSPDLLAQQLRAVSEHCSSNARSFAHKMGVADATAVFMDRSSRCGQHLRHINKATSSIQKMVKCSPMA
mmetsp:Transcript_23046/g.38091  ORF Transcript_23046/g.38091 Transcript_23046/m.38091 type:complete len:199 (+) Transcript_23046:134-730(+)